MHQTKTMQQQQQRKQQGLKTRLRKLRRKQRCKPFKHNFVFYVIYI